MSTVIVVVSRSCYVAVVARRTQDALLAIAEIDDRWRRPSCSSSSGRGRAGMAIRTTVIGHLQCCPRSRVAAVTLLVSVTARLPLIVTVGGSRSSVYGLVRQRIYGARRHFISPNHLNINITFELEKLG